MKTWRNLNRNMTKPRLLSDTRAVHSRNNLLATVPPREENVYELHKDVLMLSENKSRSVLNIQ